MSAQSMLLPGAPVPDISLPTVSGGTFAINANDDLDFHLLIFYRGWHCPACHKQMDAMKAALPDFDSRKTKITAISMDTQERAENSVKDWDMDAFDVAYDLTAEQAREWGLYLSSSRGKTSIGIEEAKIFNEPGMFLVRPDGTLFAAWVQSVPFARPDIAGLIGALDFVKNNNYPPRGTVPV